MELTNAHKLLWIELIIMKDSLRALKDIEKLKKILVEFKEHKFHAKYPSLTEWIENYLYDAEHFYKNKDYYSAFGAANYAYGMIDAILIIEGKKKDNF